MEITADSTRAEKVRDIARRVRAELGETVGAPGEKAIAAVVLMRDHPDMLQKDALARYGTTRNSVKKSRELIGRLSPLQQSQQLVLGLAAVEQPAAEQQASTQSVQPLATSSWLKQHTPDVVGLRVMDVRSVPDGYQRVLRASITLQSGAIERDTSVHVSRKFVTYLDSCTV